MNVLAIGVNRRSAVLEFRQAIKHEQAAQCSLFVRGLSRSSEPKRNGGTLRRRR
jgi:hypothetical protein